MALPMVCAPESATRSAASRMPLLRNAAWRSETLAVVGDGSAWTSSSGADARLLR